MDIIIRVAFFVATFSQALSFDCQPTSTWYLYIRGWTEWSIWGNCDHTCGGGFHHRIRYCQYKSFDQIYRNLPDTDTMPCGEVCVNYGTFLNGKCECKSGFSGRCCESAPTCRPPCENSGSCIAEDTCSCLLGYHGVRCEKSEDLDKLLLPQLHPTLPVSEINKPLSWYDSLDYAGDNKVCFIKVHVENAPEDTIFTVESIPSNDTNQSYGNFTTAPFDNSTSLNGTSRFACMQVRCAGTRVTGEEFNVFANVSMKMRYKRCHISKLTPGPAKVVVRTDTGGASDTLSILLENGFNYGPKYGIYLYTGFRDRAQYLAQHSCYSGHNFDFDHISPSEGTLADYICA